MANIEIVIINGSTVLTDEQVAAAVPALQTQIHRDFAPAWGIDANLTSIPQGASPGPGSWWLVIVDNSRQAEALGYNDVTSEGRPLGKVFAWTDRQYGKQWTVTASHALLEMLSDPDICLTALVQSDANTATLYAYEVCDACAADEYGYQIDGVLVSDFVYPAWFETFRQPGSTQFDYGNNIQKPFQLLPGGSVLVVNLASNGGWKQLTADGVPRRKAYVGSREERRQTPRDRWLKSTTERDQEATTVQQTIEMEIVQPYETTVLEAESGYAVKFFVIPMKSSALQQIASDPASMRSAVTELLGLPPAEPVSVTAIPDQIATMLAEERRRFDDPILDAFANKVTFEKLVPFEQSPLTLEALATIAANSAKVGSVAVGTTVGFISAGPTPLLLVTVPAGIVICGVAVSFTRWLEEHRSIIWSRLLKVDTSRAVVKEAPENQGRREVKAADTRKSSHRTKSGKTELEK